MNIDDAQDVPPIGFNRALDFCVWVLEVDGLHVPPFDRHGDGDGTLRALDLDPATWLAWLRIVAAAVEQRVVYQDRLCNQQAAVDARYELLFVRDEQRADERDLRGRLMLAPERIGLLGRYLRDAWAAGADVPFVAFPHPAELWPDDFAVGGRLDQLWAFYKKHELANRRRSWKGQSVRAYFTSPGFQAFERDIASLRPFPPISVTFVNYPGPVVYPVPPSVVLIGTRQWSADPQSFRDLVTDAVSLLLGADKDA